MGAYAVEIAVLGAGVSGLTAARKLQDKGYNVTVYEKCPKPGGLAKTRFTDGYLYDPHGGHIFNSKRPEIVDWVFSILPQEKWQFTIRNAKIFFSGKYISYPFELSLCELDPEEMLNCAYDYMQAQSGPEPDNFRDWLIWNFGQSIADYYMLPYNSKIWAYPLEKMETSWMRGKMPLPTKREMLRSLLLKDPNERKMPHSTFYYPLEGGVQSMVDAIAQTLRVNCSMPVERVEKYGGKWYVNGEGGYDRVISTIPLPTLACVMNLPDQVQNAISNLKYNSLTTVLFECDATDITWLYIPGSKYKAHRVGYQSALTPNATPNHGGCAALEIIGHQPLRVDGNFIRDNPILPDELHAGKVLDSEFTEYAYVIHDLDYRKNVACIKNYFNKINDFDLLGRWGTWNYHNMDLCMWDAFCLVEKRFLDGQ